MTIFILKTMAFGPVIFDWSKSKSKVKRIVELQVKVKVKVKRFQEVKVKVKSIDFCGSERKVKW